MPRVRGSLVLLLALVACAAKEQDDETRLTQARALLLRGAYDSAATEFAELAASRDSTIASAPREMAM